MNSHRQIEDFLSDESFRRWALSGQPLEGSSWESKAGDDPALLAQLRSAIGLVREMDKGLPGLSQAEFDSDLQKALETIEEKEVSKVFLESRRFNFYGWAAAVGLLALFFGWLLIDHYATPDAERYSYQNMVQQSAAGLQEMVNSKSTPDTVQLPDQSSVVLQPGSRISFRMVPGVREVYLNGNAFFNVRKEAGRPFLVYSEGVVTRVLGTSFLISNTGGRVAVSVMSGKVSVSRMDKVEDPLKNQELVLTPNQQAVYTTGPGTIRKELVENPIVIPAAVQTPLVSYDETPVEQVFEDLEKHYGIPIDFEPATVSDCHITIQLGNETFYQKLKILCETINADYSSTGGRIKITGQGCR